MGTAIAYASWQHAVLHAYSHDGGEIWKSDGTTAGTKLVKAIENVSYSDGDDYSVGSQEVVPMDGDLPQAPVAHLVGNTLFFVIADGGYSKKLWKSDGTAAGTKIVKEITPDFSDS